MTLAISGTTGITLAGQFNSASSMGFKNRIINSAMVIDQRNAGASITTASGNNYDPDRWLVYDAVGSKMSLQQVTDAPAGFVKSQKITSLAATTPSSTDYYFNCQRIEGFNIADFGWGTASAATVTLSFWVKSSLTGSFSGAFGNASFSRSYPFSYTISAANTWEQKTVTVAGDTSGTWATDNSTGIQVVFDLGSGSSRAGTANVWSANDYRKVTGSVSVVGTNGATFYVTGVQLEKGSTATSFDYRPYGTELALCQRYFEKSYVSGTVPATVTEVGVAYTLVGNSAGNPASNVYFKVSKRTTPTELSIYSPVTGTIAKVRNSTAGTDENSTAYGTSENGFAALGSTSTSATCFRFQWTAGSEL